MNDTTTGSTSELASRWSRLGAALIDGLLIAAVMMPLMYMFGLFDEMVENPYSFKVALIGAVLGIGLFFAINGKFLYETAQTVGKKILGIRVVCLNGSKPEFKDLVVKRYVPFFGVQYIPYIGGLLSLVNICFIFGQEKRCVHDLIAGTKVIKA